MPKFYDKVTGKTVEVSQELVDSYIPTKSRNPDAQPDAHQKPWFQWARWMPVPDETPTTWPKAEPDPEPVESDGKPGRKSTKSE